MFNVDLPKFSIFLWLFNLLMAATYVKSTTVGSWKELPLYLFLFLIITSIYFLLNVLHYLSEVFGSSSTSTRDSKPSRRTTFLFLTRTFPTHSEITILKKKSWEVSPRRNFNFLLNSQDSLEY